MRDRPRQRRHRHALAVEARAALAEVEVQVGAGILVALRLRGVEDVQEEPMAGVRFGARLADVDQRIVAPVHVERAGRVPADARKPKRRRAGGRRCPSRTSPASEMPNCRARRAHVRPPRQRESSSAAAPPASSTCRRPSRTSSSARSGNSPEISKYPSPLSMRPTACPSAGHRRTKNWPKVSATAQGSFSSANSRRAANAWMFHSERAAGGVRAIARYRCRYSRRARRHTRGGSTANSDFQSVPPPPPRSPTTTEATGAAPMCVGRTHSPPAGPAVRRNASWMKRDSTTRNPCGRSPTAKWAGLHGTTRMKSASPVSRASHGLFLNTTSRCSRLKRAFQPSRRRKTCSPASIALARTTGPMRAGTARSRIAGASSRRAR